MTAHVWDSQPSRTGHTTITCCATCGLVRYGPRTHIWRGISWVYVVEPVRPRLDPARPEPRAEALRTFLSDGASVERALELSDLVHTPERNTMTYNSTPSRLGMRDLEQLYLHWRQLKPVMRLHYGAPATEREFCEHYRVDRTTLRTWAAKARG